jgi:hypothetical protein
MAIKQTIPFDTPSTAEECKVTHRKIREMFEVRSTTGMVAERISRLIIPHAKTINYAGREMDIQGQGFNRFVQF